MAKLAALPIYAPYVLPDGRPLRFGPVSRASRPLIERAVARLSPLTSYRRFFTVRYRLSDAELDALTNLDCVDRFAVGASIRNGSEVDGVGVARFVRDRERPRVADLALLVVDVAPFRARGRPAGRAELAVDRHEVDHRAACA